MFTSRRARASRANAASGRKRQREQISRSPGAITTGPLPNRAHVRGRGKDKSPKTIVQIGIAYAKAGGSGAGRAVARQFGVAPEYPKKYYTACASRNWGNRRAGRCGRACSRGAPRLSSSSWTRS